MCGIWADFDFAVRFMVVSYMVTLCVLRLIVRYMAAIVRYMVDCAVYGYCAFYGLYRTPGVKVSPLGINVSCRGPWQESRKSGNV